VLNLDGTKNLRAKIQLNLTKGTWYIPCIRQYDM